MSRYKEKNRKSNETTVQGSAEIKNSKNEALTETQLYDVLKFANNYYKTYADSSYADTYKGVYTPDLTNYRLSEIGLDGTELSEEQLKKAFNAPIDNQDTLIGYSEFIKFTEMISKRTLEYMGNLPSFDLLINCTNLLNQGETKSPEYLADLKIVEDFLTKFDYKGEFAKATRRMFSIDAYYAILRTDGENYELQELPYNFCRITGKDINWGFQYDFDMSWFLKMGLSLDSYPKIFKRMFNKVYQGSKQGDYDPSNKLNERDGTFALWSQTSSLPTKGNFVCFKLNSDIFATIPFLAPLFSDVINKPLLRRLQTNQYIIASQKILIGKIPLLKDQKSGQVKDALAISPETMGKFLGLLQRGIHESIKISGVPFDGVEQVNFELPDKNMYDEYNKTVAANSGVTSRIVYSSDKMSATEMDYSVNVDEMLATQIYPQFAKWISAEINFMTKKYKFQITFEGSKLRKSREFRKNMAREYAQMGFLNEQKLASAWGMDIFELKRQMQFNKNFGIFEMLRLPPNSNTADFGSLGNGRPKTDTPSESTERSLDYEGD